MKRLLSAFLMLSLLASTLVPFSSLAADMEDTEQIAQFSGYSMTLSDDLSVNLFITTNNDAALEDLRVDFYFNGKFEQKGVIREVSDSDGNLLNCFSFKGLPPQRLGDTLTAKLYNSDNIEIDTLEFSAAEYLHKLTDPSFNTNDTFTNIANALLAYGQASQIYKGYNYDPETNKGLISAPALPEEPISPSEDLTSKFLSEPRDGKPAFVGAGVHFDTSNSIYVLVKTDDPENTTLYFEDENTTLTLEETDQPGIYKAYSRPLKAYEYCKGFTFHLCENGEKPNDEGYMLTYSVSAYAYDMSSKDTDMGRLAKALYYYAEAIHTWMIGE